MTEIFTTDYPLTNIAPGSQAYIECGQGGQLYVRTSSHDQFTLNIEGVGTLIGHSGLQVRGIEARKIEVRNNGADPLDLVINIGSAEIIDRRASVSETLRVHDPVDGSSFADVLSLMQNANDQRLGVNTIGDNWIFYSSLSGVATIIDPSANLNGVILRTLFADTSSSNFFVYVDETPPSTAVDTSKRALVNTGTPNNIDPSAFLPLLIPAGIGLYFATGTGIRSGATWDVL